MENKNKNKINCPNCNQVISVHNDQCPYCNIRFDLNTNEKSKNSIFNSLNQIFSKNSVSDNTKKKAKNLISLDSVKNLYNFKSENYSGIKEIKLIDIIGSTDRYNDFNSYFLPVKGFTTQKLDPIVKKMKNNIDLPPVKLYELGGKYFVIDGHHRISASLLLEREFIDAEVIKITVDVKLDEDNDVDSNLPEGLLKDFVIDLEKKSFEKKTYLYENIISHPIKVTAISSYGKLLDDILFQHKSNLLLNKNCDLIVSSFEWYRQKFLPVSKLITDYNLLEKFPKRTISDLYVWILMHKYFLSKETKHDIGFRQTIVDFVKINGKKKYHDEIPTRFDDYITYIINER